MDTATDKVDKVAAGVAHEPFVDRAHLSHNRHCWKIHPLLQRLLFLSFLLPTMGCNQQSKTASQDSTNGQELAKERRPNAPIAPGASPTEVAKAALLAIETNDTVTLEQLIAIKKVKQDVEALTHGRKNFQGMVDKAIPIAISAIASEINGLDAEGRAIDRETITGSTALVTVQGTRAGKQLTQRFFLVQEDSQWRLVPSHR